MSVVQLTVVLVAVLVAATFETNGKNALLSIGGTAVLSVEDAKGNMGKVLEARGAVVVAALVVASAIAKSIDAIGIT